MTELQECRAFIKWKFPVGTVIEDYNGHHSGTYTIKKRSVFHIFIKTNKDYNQFSQREDKDLEIHFYVADPGKNSIMYLLQGWYRKRDILLKYWRVDKYNIEHFINKGETLPRWLSNIKTYLYTDDSVEITEPNQIVYQVAKHNLLCTDITAQEYKSVFIPNPDRRILTFSTPIARQNYIDQNLDRVLSDYMTIHNALMVVTNGKLNEIIESKRQTLT